MTVASGAAPPDAVASVAVRQSRSLPLVYDLARWAVDLLPPAERPRLLAPSAKPPAGLPAGLMLPSVPRLHAQLENVTQ